MIMIPFLIVCSVINFISDCLIGAVIAQSLANIYKQKKLLKKNVKGR